MEMMAFYLVTDSDYIIKDHFLGSNQHLFHRKFKKVDVESSKASTAAIMEGKLKEKLESMGIAALCVAQSAPTALCSVCKSSESGGQWVGFFCYVMR